MKRLALVVVLLSLSTACASMTKGGNRGPQIQRTAEPAPSEIETGLDKRPELGER